MKESFLKYKLIQPKKAVSVNETPHPVFLTSITADPYIGCKYACPYCYTIKEEGSCFIKTNIVGQLSKKLEEISKIKKMPDSRPSIMIGGMTDPYQEAEAEMMVTKRCLELIIEKEFPLQVFTKSEGILRDIDLLSCHSSKGLAAVNITLFTINDALWRSLENNVPPPDTRLKIISKLKKKGVLCGVVLMPIFPFINDTLQELEKIFRKVKKAGAEYIIPGCYSPLTPRVKKRVSKITGKNFNSVYGEKITVSADYAAPLEKILFALSKEYEIPLSIPIPGTQPAVNLNMDPVNWARP